MPVVNNHKLSMFSKINGHMVSHALCGVSVGSLWGSLWLFHTSDLADLYHNSPSDQIFTTGGRHKICNSVEFTVYHVITFGITVHIVRGPKYANTANLETFFANSKF